jgi:hypothetical protein
MANLPPDKEIAFVFDRDTGFKQVLVSRNPLSDGCTITVNGTLSASIVLGASGSGSGTVGPSGSQGPSGSVGPAGPTGSVPNIASYSGFSSSNYFVGSVNTLVGNAAGFTACVMVRPEGFATGTEVAFGNFSVYQTLGGWFIGIDSERWKFGIGQQSDGSVPDNFGSGLQSLTQYQGRFIRRLFLLHLVYNGTIATLYVNGQAVQTLTPTGGYEIADAALFPRIGRNTNNGEPLPATTLGVVGAGYVESVFTATNVVNHYVACLEAESFQDASFTNWWAVDTAETNLVDQGGALDFTLSGSLTAVDVTARW